MKKLGFLYAMMFVVSLAMAQTNDASIQQTGDDHEALIQQIGSLNKSYVVQEDGSEGNNPGTVAKADILQQGDENYVNVRQRAFYGNQNSTANITQIGDNNSVRGVNEGEQWFQNQTGGLLDVYMEGDGNTLRSLAGEAQKNNNSLELVIYGGINDVAAVQEFGNATIDIDGDDNDVVLKQKSFANFDAAKYNNADIDIVGSFNDVTVDQMNNANNAVVDILGSSNVASIIQTGN